MDLSIIIPFYNEENRLPANLRKILDFFSSKDLSFEIILVDDGSSDQTLGKIKSFLEKGNVKLLRHERNQGKGAAVRTGMMSGQGNYLFFTDADLSTPVSEIEKLSKEFPAQDIVIGSRSLAESNLIKKQPFYRIFIGKFGNFLIKSILGLPFNDTQCGFKVFKKRAAQELFQEQTLNGWSFDYEILYLARKKNFSIKEIPVSWENSPASKFNPVADSAKCFLDLLKIRFIHR